MDYLYELYNYCYTLLFAKNLTTESYRIQIKDNNYLRFISNPSNAKGIVLIFKGGCNHFEDELPHYVKILNHYIQDTRLILFEKITPIINFNEFTCVSDCIKHLRKTYPNEKIYILGFSMGGIFVYNYLASGLDEADGYITICSPLNLEYFSVTVESNYLFKIIQNRVYRENNVDNLGEFLGLFGITENEHIDNSANLLNNLKINTKPNTLRKTLAIIGENDSLTRTFLMDRINYPIPTLIVENAYHCCINSIEYAAYFINICLHKSFDLKVEACEKTNDTDCLNCLFI